MNAKELRKSCVESLRNAKTLDLDPLKMGESFILKGVIFTEAEWKYLLELLRTEVNLLDRDNEKRLLNKSG